MRVAKWGNSLAVRLPADVAQQLDLKEGDEVEIVAKPDDAANALRRKKVDDLIEHMQKLRGRLPKDFKFDRDEANSR
jgi:antitoxin MazE